MNAYTSDKQFSRLLYTSALDIECCGEKPAETVRRIAEGAAEQNRLSDLTQILEGPQDEVEKAFERICCDFRHVDVRLIDLINVSERLFEGWNMAFLSDDEMSSLALGDELQEIQFLAGVNASQATLQMRSLLDNHSAASKA